MDLPHTRGRGFRIPTRSWSDIEEFYSRASAEHGWGDEMVELVRHIRAQGHADRLFAFTSMCELIIGLYPELEREVESLHVLYAQGAYHLKYFASPTREPEVERTYPKAVGLKKFDDFLGYLNW
jgi:hypothetical protein